LSECFYEKALLKKTVAQNLELETEFAALADWIQNAKKGVPRHSLQVTIKLQVSFFPIKFNPVD
jgi:hypothetical protein